METYPCTSYLRQLTPANGWRRTADPERELYGRLARG